MTAKNTALIPAKDEGRNDQAGTGSAPIASTPVACLARARAAALARRHLVAAGAWGDWQAAAFRTTCSSSSCRTGAAR